MQRILIIEDDEKLREELKIFLNKNGYEATALTTFDNTINDILKINPDLILLDINLPNTDGEYICKEIRKKSNMPIIIVTSRDNEIDELLSINNGADHYITKPFNILEVKARMKAILRRNAVTEKKVAKSNVIIAGDMKIDCDSRNLYIAGRPINLTAKEFDLLELLAVNPGKVYSRDNLLKAVWGQDYSGDGRTVDVHMRRLREKIEDNPSEPKYVHTKWGVGYYFNV